MNRIYISGNFFYLLLDGAVKPISDSKSDVEFYYDDDSDFVNLTGDKLGNHHLRFDSLGDVDGNPLIQDDVISLLETTGFNPGAGGSAPSLFQEKSEKGQANGYPSLNGSGVIPDVQIPSNIARDSELQNSINTAKQEVKNEILGGASNLFDTLKEVEDELNADNALTVLVNNRLDALEASILTKLNADRVNNCRVFGGIASSLVNSTLYAGSANEPTIIFEGSTKSLRAQFAGFGWVDLAQIKVDGNSSTIRGVADDISSQDGSYYFNTSGNRNTAFDLENYGSLAVLSFNKEFFNTGFASGFALLSMGGSNLNYTIFINNPQS